MSFIITRGKAGEPAKITMSSGEGALTIEGSGPFVAEMLDAVMHCNEVREWLRRALGEMSPDELTAEIAEAMARAGLPADMIARFATGGSSGTASQ